MADPYPSLASSPDPRRWLRVGNFLVTLLQNLRGHEVTPWSGCPSAFSVPLGLTGELLGGRGIVTVVPEVASEVASGTILSNSPGLCGFLRGSLFASHGDVSVTLI